MGQYDFNAQAPNCCHRRLAWVDSSTNLLTLRLLRIMALARVGERLLKSAIWGVRRVTALNCSEATFRARGLLKSPTTSLLLTSRLLTQFSNSGAFATHHVSGVLGCSEGLTATGGSLIQKRGVVKWSHRTGKRKTVKSVVKRFMYLDWAGRGIWIRPRSGKYKRRWKQSSRRKARLNQHVFTNATQSRMLDKMATKFWRKQFHFIDDMYADFHVRDNFPLTSRPPPAP